MARKSYYETRARDWELQMLIKARVAAGDPEAGRALLDFVEPLIYSTRSTSRPSKKCRRRANASTRSWRHGGGAAGRLRSTSSWRPAASGTSNFWCSACSGCTAAACRGCGTAARCWRCSRLQDKDLLSATEYGRLASPTSFSATWSTVCRFAEDRQTHTLPADRHASLESAGAENAVGVAGRPGSLAEQLLQELNAHLEAVRDHL